MKRFSEVLIVYLLFGLTGIVRAEVLIKPNDPTINYYGRFDMSNASTAVKFNWPGSIIEACFPGPSIGAELNDGGGYFNVEIDGILVDSIRPSTTTHRTIRTNLSTTADHTIRRTIAALCGQKPHRRHRFSVKSSSPYAGMCSDGSGHRLLSAPPSGRSSP